VIRSAHQVRPAACREKMVAGHSRPVIRSSDEGTSVGLVCEGSSRLDSPTTQESRRIAAYNSTLDIDGKQASPHVGHADPRSAHAPPESGLTDTDSPETRRTRDPPITGPGLTYRGNQQVPALWILVLSAHRGEGGGLIPRICDCFDRSTAALMPGP
jgi:hypothetical protein